MQQNNRVTWIDMAKGYGIILVVLAHLDVGVLGQWIYTFHMPLFFLLSGYVFNDNYDFKTFLSKKVRAIVVPYIVFAIILIVFNGFFYKAYDGYLLIDYIKLVLEYVIQKRVSTLWFLACLFWLNILFYFTRRMLKNNKQLACCSLVLVIVGILYYNVFNGKGLPWNIDVCLMAYPFFWGGVSV